MHALQEWRRIPSGAHTYNYHIATQHSTQTRRPMQTARPFPPTLPAPNPRVALCTPCVCDCMHDSNCPQDFMYHAQFRAGGGESSVSAMSLALSASAPSRVRGLTLSVSISA